eukprot:CAMPEP_0194068172 /NCGR_PEP_ID=MMETSP0009_2-20130614/86950_1 /TAXON_ID=210454 /ORGANISM="Grammatophora oceanica, Strain CCMP 410" /LENGTH=75 /DNA_ID=CAMNT_0038721243 /DNA_START=922 /DNA_END=1149 /DNA_ORIENTATION=+
MCDFPIILSDQAVADLDQSLSKAGYMTTSIAAAYGDARTDANSIVWHVVGLILMLMLLMLDPRRHDTADTIELLH